MSNQVLGLPQENLDEFVKFTVERSQSKNLPPIITGNLSAALEDDNALVQKS